MRRTEPGRRVVLAIVAPGPGRLFERYIQMVKAMTTLM